MKKIISLVVLVLFTCSCALTDASLPVSAQNVNVKVSQISQIPQNKFSVVRAIDSRPNKLIGNKRNGFGVKTADVSSKTPVENVVAAAFAKMLYNNGHSVIYEGADIEVELDVRKFGFDNKVNFWSIETMAEVETHVKLRDSRTSRLLLDKVYRGESHDKSWTSYLKTWDETITIALENMINQISSSPEFANALLK